jgi:hypothetical protein
MEVDVAVSNVVRSCWELLRNTCIHYLARRYGPSVYIGIGYRVPEHTHLYLTHVLDNVDHGYM